MSIKLAGFTVRRAKPGEVGVILQPFGSAWLTRGAKIVYGAFGQPGDFPLGGMIVRPTNDTSAQFQVIVHPEYRRNKIGTRLMENLFSEARRVKTTYLRLTALVHQNSPENVFCRKVGLVPERSFATYQAPLADRLLPICAPIAARFHRQNQAETSPRAVPFNQLPPERIAKFFTDYYVGDYDHRLEELQRGVFDRDISHAVVIQDNIVAAAFFQARPGNPAIYLDLLLVHPDHRRSPMAVVLLEKMCRSGLARGFAELVWEADAQHDPFATHFAQRLGCTPLWYRYRYSIHLPPAP